MRYIYITTLLSCILTISGIAQDRQFARTYQSSTLPKGAMDLEGWNTYRFGRKTLYNRLDQRIEFEVGLCDNVQTAFYFNLSHKLAAAGDTLDGVTKSSSFTFSNEWKWNVINSATHKFGFALYGELTVGAHEVELEGKLIFDKKTEKNLLALNIVGEYEMGFGWEDGKTVMEKEIKVENDFAYLRLIKPNFGLGIELKQHNVFVDGAMEHSALFGGPTIYYSGARHFIILNILPQWMNMGETKDTDALDLSEYEKFEIRLLFGFGM